MAKSTPPAKPKKKRDRGTASLMCPKPRCGGATEVLRTGREGPGVQRHRRCLRCGHEFHSSETAMVKKEKKEAA